MLGCCDDGPPLKTPLFRELCAQHDQLLSILATLRAGAAGAAVKVAPIPALVAFAALAETHHALEEAKFLPLLGRLGVYPQAEQLLFEHRAADRAVETIRNRLVVGAPVTVELEALELALRAHIEHEGRLFREFDDRAG